MIYVIIFLILMGSPLVWYFLIYYPGKRKKAVTTYQQQWDTLLRNGFKPDSNSNYIYRRTVTIPDGGLVKYNYLAMDMEHGLCAYEFRTFKMIDIVKIEILNDSTVVQSASSKFGGGGLIGVIVPGVTGFGGGSQQHSGEKIATVAIRVMLDNRTMPSVTIPFLFNVVEKASQSFQSAMSCAYEVYGIFEGYVRYRDEHMLNDKNDTTGADNTEDFCVCSGCGANILAGSKFCSCCGKEVKLLSLHSTEQLNHLTALYENGILTEDEYEEKKQKLLTST